MLMYLQTNLTHIWTKSLIGSMNKHFVYDSSFVGTV